MTELTGVGLAGVGLAAVAGRVTWGESQELLRGALYQRVLIPCIAVVSLIYAQCAVTGCGV